VAAVDDRPFAPGSYDVVVVGSGPGGLQMSYCLSRLGIDHAVLSRDDAPGGMFRDFPVYQRLISWTKPEAPFARDSREYEWYDHNSLVADEPELRALVRVEDRTYDLPLRAEMEAGLVAFAERARLLVRYGCAWEATRRDGDALVLETSDGEYRCRAAVFAVGVTSPWLPDIPGIEHARHYVDTHPPRQYEGRRVFIIGKRNSGFEVAQSLLSWARELVLASPRPVQMRVLALSGLRVRYLHPYDEYARGGPGTYVLDAAIDRIERNADGFRVVADGTRAGGGRLELEVDDVIAATGFRTPLLDLPELGVATVSEGRIPALGPFWESVSAPGVFFAGNATLGSRGPVKRGLGASSGAVNGFRYNARVLARHLAERLGNRVDRPRLPADAVVPLLVHELSHSPELWVQKGYLARVLTLSDGVDEGIVPVSHFLDADGPDAVAAAIEVDPEGTIYPILYRRRSGEIEEHQLPPHPLNVYEDAPYRQQIEALLG
jgi:thioredoxin reductase